MRRYVHFTSLWLLLFFLFHLVVSEIPSNQRNTMINLRNLLQNDTGQSPWNSARDPCSWRGVTCDSENSSITRFSLQFFSLSNPDFLPVLCQIDTLESIDLSNNHLSSIPIGFMIGCGNLSGLRELDFSRNRLSGSLPNFDGFLKLEVLDLSRNSLRGTISLQRDGLVSLKLLSLGYNLFVGKIPEYIANYSNLIKIDLSYNNLSGSIPDRFRELPNLQVLNLSSNCLSGEIPKFLSNIQTLSISYNQLNGSIPSNLLSKPNLRTVDLSDNSLEGSVPENISSSLVRLRLRNNRLSGTIPSSSFGSLQNLTYLELDNNSLGGPIPRELGFCKSLALLNLAKNQLTGLLPVELGNLTKLEELKLEANKLVGEIPSEITQLQVLRKLNISWNSLNGSIPSSVSRLRNLTHLDLRENNLSGSIPESIDNLNSLIELQLGSNGLSGKIPSMPRSLQIALNLSSNLLEGVIPETLSRLERLEVLDLSNNKLTGIIPGFPPHVSVDTTGNPDLVNPTEVTEPSPTQKTKKTLSPLLLVVIGAGSTIVISIGAFVVLWIYKKDAQIQSEEHFGNDVHRSNIDGLFSCFCFCKTPKIQSEVSATNHGDIFQIWNYDGGIAYEDMIKSTNDFDIKYCIGTGGYGSVYRAQLPSGKVVALKKLHRFEGEDPIFDRCFRNEVQMLTNVRHKSIVKLYGFCLHNRCMFLVYEYMEKGSLFCTLRFDVEAFEIGWIQRVKIIEAMAHALS